MKKWLCILAIALTLVDFTHGQTVGGTGTSRASWQNPSADGVPPVFPVGKVTPFSEGGVSLQPYQRGDRPSAERQWAKLSERGDAEALRAPAFAAFLSNESGQRILAMTWISTWIDSEGTTHQYVSRYDTLLQGGAIFPKEVDRLLISSSYHSVSGPNPKPAGFSLSNLLIPPTLNNLVDFDAVALSKCTPGLLQLDTVILEDGTVLGPDSSETVRQLTTRKKAIETVTKQLLELLDRQKDPTSILQEYGDRESDLLSPVTFWTARVASIYLASTNQRAIAAQFSTAANINFSR